MTTSETTTVATRLALRPEAHPVTVGSTLWILGPGGSHRIGDAGLGRWLERLTPLLDGTRTLEEITGHLSPEARERAAVLLRALLRRGILRETTGPSPDGSPDSLVRLLAYFADDPAERALRLRQEPLVLTGGGELAEAIGRAAVLGGLQLRRAPGAGLLTLAAAADPGRPLAQATECDGEIWIGIDLDSARLRHRPAPGSARARDGAGDGAGAGRRVAANHLVNATVRALTALPGALTPNTVEVFPPGRLTAVQHRCRPHPFASAGDPHRPAGAMERTSQPEFSRSAVRLVDDDFGLLGSLGDADIPQLPLHVYATEVADPVSPHRTAPAVGYGRDLESARCAAALHGLARYASVMIDPRRVRDRDGTAFRRPHESLAAALTRLRAAPAEARVAGYEPDRDRPVWVPADQAFPVLVPGGDERPDRGLAAGYTQEQAVLEGLLSQVRGLVAEELGAVPAGGEVRVARQLSTLVGEVRVRDLSAVLGIPAAAVTAGGQTEVECGTDPADALDRALDRALLRAQAGPGRIRDPRPFAGAPKAPDPEVQTQVRRLTGILRDRGLTVQVVPLDHDPEVTMVIPAPVRVVVTDAAV